ncbi:MAG: hypothetical protein BAJALOKI1v1_270028 [Promethearchaeota archaeon]|nr:MAG: hypothetical protein BAJALOKI1v1_270028 [Candidatus Lokiarchaeota archaeon]
MDLQKQYYEKFKNIFLHSNLHIWTISDEQLMNSKEMEQLKTIFPNGFKIFMNGMKIYKKETFRTLRHTIHTLKVYYSIMADRFEINLKEENIVRLKKELKDLYAYNPLLVPLILLYHDLSRPFNRTWHNLVSEELIRENELLKRFTLPKIIEKLIRIVIKHHLLIGTIFTGESSYYGSSTLYSDLITTDESISPWQIHILFKTLKVFTFIDIWGYDYGIIYDHYFYYYNEIARNLSVIFRKCFNLKNLSQQQEWLKDALFRLDQYNLKWRIAGALRIFQFVSTKSYLTEKFYFAKIEEGLLKQGTSWNEFRRSLNKNHPRIQLKYALPLMMVLASKHFERAPIRKSFKIYKDIFDFWDLCSKKVNDAISSFHMDNGHLFYFIFDLPRHWFFNSSYRDYVKQHILSNISVSSFSFNEKISEYNINIIIKEI